MALKTCRVSFTDADGNAHLVRVQAESLYEAAVLGLGSLARPDWIDVIGPYTRITVRLDDSSVEHFVMFAQVAQWLARPAKAPAEHAKKKRLRDLLAM